MSETILNAQCLIDSISDKLFVHFLHTLCLRILKAPPVCSCVMIGYTYLSCPVLFTHGHANLTKGNKKVTLYSIRRPLAPVDSIG